MSTTEKFLELRSSLEPKVGEWNINFEKAKELAEKNNKFLVVCWSNGDECGYCTAVERCMMEKTFVDWMKKSDAYWVFQYSGDPNKGKAVHDYVYNGTGLRFFPGFRFTLGNVDESYEGNTLRGNKSKATGATNMVKNISAIFSKAKGGNDGNSKQSSTVDYKVRFNEKKTVKKINAILDAIDANDGYCPCQAERSANTKCRCADFRNNKKIGEVCICNLYVKKNK